MLVRDALALWGPDIRLDQIPLRCSICGNKGGDVRGDYPYQTAGGLRLNSPRVNKGGRSAARITTPILYPKRGIRLDLRADAPSSETMAEKRFSPAKKTAKRAPRVDERPQSIIRDEVSVDGGRTWRAATPADAKRYDIIRRVDFAPPEE
jgi:hypothetical protein